MEKGIKVKKRSIIHVTKSRFPYRVQTFWYCSGHSNGCGLRVGIIALLFWHTISIHFCIQIWKLSEYFAKLSWLFMPFLGSILQCSPKWWPLEQLPETQEVKCSRLPNKWLSKTEKNPNNTLPSNIFENMCLITFISSYIHFCTFTVQLISVM